MEITEDILKFVLYGRWKSPLNTTSLDQTVRYADSILVPREICISPTTLPGGHLGVFCTQFIHKGTEMGPFTGDIIDASIYYSARYNTAMWEIFDQQWEVTDFIDGRMNRAGWLAYIQCARTDEEQNMEVVQIHKQIFYRATRDIEPGEELLVWYSHNQPLYMGIPCTVSPPANRGQKAQFPLDNDKDAEDNQQPNLLPFTETTTKRKCTICGRGFNSRSNLRSHMRTHTLEKPFSCSHCGRRFSQSSTLRNHVRLHTGERPYMCAVCKSRYSQLAGLRAHQRSAAHRAISG